MPTHTKTWNNVAPLRRLYPSNHAPISAKPKLQILAASMAPGQQSNSTNQCRIQTLFLLNTIPQHITTIVNMVYFGRNIMLFKCLCLAKWQDVQCIQCIQCMLSVVVHLVDHKWTNGATAWDHNGMMQTKHHLANKEFPPTFSVAATERRFESTSFLQFVVHMYDKVECSLPFGVKTHLSCRVVFQKY